MKRYSKTIIQALLITATAVGVCLGNSDAPFGFIEAIRECRLPVPNADHIFAPGESYPLLQNNAEFYIIALTEDTMAAVQKFDRKGNPIAWVTVQKQLIFGDKARAMDGFLILREGNILPILRENPKFWAVDFNAYRHSFRLSIPRELPAELAFVPPEKELEPVAEPIWIARAEPEEPPPFAPKPVVAPAPKPVRASIAKTPVPAAAEKPVEAAKPQVIPQAVPAVAEKPAAPIEQPTPATVEPPAVEPVPVVLPAPVVIPDAPIGVLKSVEEPPPAPVPAPAEPEPEPVAVPEAASIPAPVVPKQNPFLRFLDKYILSSYILLLIVIIEGVFIIRLQTRPRARPAARAKKEPPPVLPEIDLTAFKKYFQSLRTSLGQISGPLGSFTTYQLIYYLHTAKETGGLEIEQKKGMVSAELFFSNGEIVHAFVGNKVDDEAVLEILCMSCEAFNYTHLPVIIEQHTIRNPTVNFLIAAAPQTPDEPEATATEDAEVPVAEERPAQNVESGPGKSVAGEDESASMLARLLAEEDEGQHAAPAAPAAPAANAGKDSDEEWDEIMKSLKVLDEIKQKPKQ